MRRKKKKWDKQIEKKGKEKKKKEKKRKERKRWCDAMLLPLPWKTFNDNFSTSSILYHVFSYKKFFQVI